LAVFICLLLAKKVCFWCEFCCS